MPVSTPTREFLIIVGVVMVVGLAGCDSTPSESRLPTTSGPAGLTTAPGKEVVSTAITSGRFTSNDVKVQWDDQGRIEVTTWGSSLCPIRATDVELLSATELALTLDTRADDDPGPTCFDDRVPLVSPIFPPDGLDVTSALTIHFRNGLTLVLPPRP